MVIERGVEMRNYRFIEEGLRLVEELRG